MSLFVFAKNIIPYRTLEEVGRELERQRQASGSATLSWTEKIRACKINLSS